MQLVRDGRPEALDQITRCYSQRLMAAGRRHCRTYAEAEDAVQDALISAAETLPQLRNDGSLESFLVRVVASACRRIGRGQKNAAELHDSEAELAAAGDPEQEAERRELAERLERTLLQLAPRDRSIVLLAELEGFSAAEVGAELQMTEGAVRTRLSRLRARLSEALSQK
ncbi:MAG TPA: sigma-70 family RNA polymerase sigma factor [Polyangiaceae bacterium]|nr:sigma-70 family RNA polymerase sigma factor [Polyangiaceae bacterium]